MQEEIRIVIVISETEKKLLDIASHSQDKTIADFVKDSAMVAAKRNKECPCADSLPSNAHTQAGDIFAKAIKKPVKTKSNKFKELIVSNRQSSPRIPL